MRKLVILLLAFLIGGLCACSSSTMNVSPQKQPVMFNSRWGIVPLSNHTQTSQAGESAASITASLLKACGVMSVSTYAVQSTKDQLLSIEQIPIKTILRWAHSMGLRYVVSGSVNEWRYKIGLDGEPVVNVALQIIDVRSGRVVWAAVGGRTGGSRAGLTIVAQRLIASMLVTIQ